MTEKLTQKTEEEFTTELISSKIKRRMISTFLKGVVSYLAVSGFRYYECKNCGGHNIEQIYNKERVLFTPNPQIFGEKVKGYIKTIEDPIKYACKRCGAENKDIDVLAFGQGGGFVEI